MAPNNTIALQTLQGRPPTSSASRSTTVTTQWGRTFVPAAHTDMAAASAPGTAGLLASPPPPTSSARPTCSATASTSRASGPKLRENVVVCLKVVAVIAGLVVAYVALLPAYEAVKLAKWTSMKDFRDDCRNHNSSSDLLAADCEAALRHAMSPPPFFPHSSDAKSFYKSEIVQHRFMTRFRAYRSPGILLVSIGAFVTVASLVLVVFGHVVGLGWKHLRSSSRQRPPLAAPTPSALEPSNHHVLPISWVATSVARYAAFTGHLPEAAGLRLRRSARYLSIAEDEDSCDDWMLANASSLATCDSAGDFVYVPSSQMGFTGSEVLSAHQPDGKDSKRQQRAAMRRLKLPVNRSVARISTPSNGSKVRQSTTTDPNIDDTKLGLDTAETNLLRQMQNIVQIRTGAPLRPPHERNRLVLDPEYLGTLSAHFDDVLMQVSGRITKLEDAVSVLAKSTFPSRLCDTDRDTARIRQILGEIGLLEEQYGHIKRIGDVVRRLRCRIDETMQRLERRRT